jgi:biopolymer transport protein ExbD
MAKEVDQEETSLDMTSMIDVVFLLIIFFILMPPKKMEGQLQSYLPQDGQSETPPPKDEDPPPKFYIDMVSQVEGDKVKTQIKFNGGLVTTVTSLSIPALDKIYEMPSEQKRKILEEEMANDEAMLDPNVSPDMMKLIKMMGDAAVGSPENKDTDVIITATTNVPFKVVLAILNAGAGAEFKNLKFSAPDKAKIFAPD